MSVKEIVRIILILLALVISADHTAAGVFNNQRKGFTLGLGIGPAITSVSSKREVYPDMHEEIDSKSEAGFGFKFTMGYAPSNKIEAYFYGAYYIFGEAYETEYFNIIHLRYEKSTVLQTHYVLGIGVRLYPREEAPSLFYGGGVINSIFIDPFIKSEIERPGIYLEAGYEITRYWSLSANLIWSWSKEELAITGDDEQVLAKSSIISAAFSLSFILY